MAIRIRWYDGYWWPSAYYGSGWPWWGHHHRYWGASYGGCCGYSYDYGYGSPSYYNADYYGSSPGYYGYGSSAYGATYSTAPAWNSAYLSEASYTPQMCVQRSYVWDDYYGGYVARQDYVPC